MAVTESTTLLIDVPQKKELQYRATGTGAETSPLYADSSSSFPLSTASRIMKFKGYVTTESRTGIKYGSTAGNQRFACPLRSSFGAIGNYGFINFDFSSIGGLPAVSGQTSINLDVLTAASVDAFLTMTIMK